MIRISVTVPGAAPETDIGSFEVVRRQSGLTVSIYWKPVPVYLQNGDNFKYTITLVNEDGGIR